jgi:hypothetical protein
MQIGIPAPCSSSKDFSFDLADYLFSAHLFYDVISDSAYFPSIWIPVTTVGVSVRIYISSNRSPDFSKTGAAARGSSS